MQCSSDQNVLTQHYFFQKLVSCNTYFWFCTAERATKRKEKKAIPDAGSSGINSPRDHRQSVTVKLITLVGDKVFFCGFSCQFVNFLSSSSSNPPPNHQPVTPQPSPFTLHITLFCLSCQCPPSERISGQSAQQVHQCPGNQHLGLPFSFFSLSSVCTKPEISNKNLIPTCGKPGVSETWEEMANIGEWGMGY